MFERGHYGEHLCDGSVLFFFILYLPVNKLFSYLGWVFLASTSTKQGIKCLAQGHNTVPPPVRLQPASPCS